MRSLGSGSNLTKPLIAALLAPAILGAVAYKESKRLGQTTTVLREMSHADDKGVPQELSRKAHCIVIVPGLKKIAFIGGGKYGRGYASCITPKGAWSAPAAVRIEGGSFGLQLGGSETDVILLVMNDGGMQKLTADKFTLGGEANAAAGPVGRNLSAQTDVLMKAEILTYSRSRGVFAGLSLEGATLRPDKDENAKLYGREVSQADILSGSVARVPETAALMRQIQLFSGKGAPAVKKGKRGRAVAQTGQAMTDSTTTAFSASAASNPVATGRQIAKADSTRPMVATSEAPLTGDTSSLPAADNSRRNTRDRAPSQKTADQGKNNLSDLEIERRIRRSVVVDKSLSTYAHNVKIVATNGSVTLKGPVRTEDEKANVAAKATAVVAADRITNQIEIAPK